MEVFLNMLIRNPDWKNLGKPTVGDIVHLKNEYNTFRYLYKVLVTSINDQVIQGTLDSVFDWNTENPILAGDITKEIGKNVHFEMNVVHNVIKNNRK